MPVQSTSGSNSLSADEAPEIIAVRQLIESGNLDGAREVARANSAFIPSSESAWAQYHALLEILDLRGQDEIITVKFLELCPNAATARLSLALMMSAGRRKKEAQAQIDILVAGPAQTPEFWNGLARAAWSVGNWPQVIDAAQAGLRLTPNSFRMHFNYAAALWFLTRVREAVTAFGNALDYANNTIIPCFEIIRFADRWRVPDTAANALTRALQIAAAKPGGQGWAQLIPLLENDFSPPRTERFFAAALAAKITNPEALAPVFDYACTAADPPIALALGRQLLALNPTLPDLPARLEKLETAQAPSSDSWWQALKPATKP